MKKLLTSILIVCALLTAPTIITGCKAPHQVVAYKTLASLEAAVTQAGNAFVAEVRAGRVAPERIAAAIEASAKFNAAYTAAITIAKTSDAPAPQSVADAAAVFLSAVIIIIR